MLASPVVALQWLDITMAGHHEPYVTTSVPSGTQR
jgi:hypothetical protein